MNKVSKKEVRNAVDDAIQQTLAKFEISSPTKKTKKLATAVSKKFSDQIKAEIKKKFKKATKAVAKGADKVARKKDRKITVAA